MEASGETPGLQCGLAPARLLLWANHSVCRGARLCSRLPQAVISQLQGLFPRPRSAVSPPEVSPMAWGGGTRPISLWELPGRAACVRMRVRSSTLCPASSFSALRLPLPLCSQALSVPGRTREKPEPRLPLGCPPADVSGALVQPARPPAPPPSLGEGRGRVTELRGSVLGLTVALCVCLAGRLYPVPQHRRGRSPLDPISGPKAGGADGDDGDGPSAAPWWGEPWDVRA